METLRLELSDLEVESLEIDAGATEAQLEELTTGHGMIEVGASALPITCCSCCIPCCCCCLG